MNTKDLHLTKRKLGVDFREHAIVEKPSEQSVLLFMWLTATRHRVYKKQTLYSTAVCCPITYLRNYRYSGTSNYGHSN
jgi:hypothetical protein